MFFGPNLYHSKITILISSVLLLLPSIVRSDEISNIFGQIGPRGDVNDLGRALIKAAPEALSEPLNEMNQRLDGNKKMIQALSDDLDCTTGFGDDQRRVKCFNKTGSGHSSELTPTLCLDAFDCRTFAKDKGSAGNHICTTGSAGSQTAVISKELLQKLRSSGDTSVNLRRLDDTVQINLCSIPEIAKKKLGLNVRLDNSRPGQPRRCHVQNFFSNIECHQIFLGKQGMFCLNENYPGASRSASPEELQGALARVSRVNLGELAMHISATFNSGRPNPSLASLVNYTRCDGRFLHLRFSNPQTLLSATSDVNSGPKAEIAELEARK